LRPKAELAAGLILKSRSWKGDYLDNAVHPGSKWGMLALTVKAPQAFASGTARNAYA
jgi:hypothetical protein